MAPAVVEAAANAGSAAKEFKKESAAARLLGSGIASLHTLLQLTQLTAGKGSAGIAELAIFHPVCQPPLNDSSRPLLT